jgi:hypothetical protein
MPKEELEGKRSEIEAPAKRLRRAKRQYDPGEWELLSDLADYLVRISADGKLDGESATEGESLAR